MPRKEKYEATLCWDCANATGSCSWSHDFTPVEGWDAEEVTSRYGVGDSYLVKACPQFKEDDPDKKKTYHQKEILGLYEAGLKQALNDYDHSVRFDTTQQDAKSVERFFKHLGIKGFEDRAEIRHRMGIKLIEASLGKPIRREPARKFWTCPNCGKETAYKTRDSSKNGNVTVGCSTCRIYEYVTSERVDVYNPEQYMYKKSEEKNNGE